MRGRWLRDSGTNSDPSELSLLSSIPGTKSLSESSPELPSISIGTSGAGQWMGKHGITPFELDEPPTTSGMLCISISSSITSRVPYLRCRMTDFSSSRVTMGYIWNTTEVGDRNQMPSLSRLISPFG
ncbi:hypothetical protein PIB30_004735 [Stylosanthes scabra]|uniref:Uncharacterized protein n=1 Tax=Stylosanthes scabra TaxID=79078 RepID=A0ABU6S3K6_9FABA|nr:hypothetical protein [Stylosanthes scabra]